MSCRRKIEVMYILIAVLSGKARLPGLVRLPISDEHQSFVEYARDGGTMYAPFVTSHGNHGFILHGNEDEDIAGGAVCDACIKVINKPPFYRCAVCPNFFFHHHCYHAPAFILSHPAHKPDHIIGLATTNGPTLDGSICPHCRCPSLQVFYECTRCLLYLNARRCHARRAHQLTFSPLIG